MTRRVATPEIVAGFGEHRDTVASIESSFTPTARLRHRILRQNVWQYRGFTDTQILGAILARRLLIRTVRVTPWAAASTFILAASGHGSPGAALVLESFVGCLLKLP
jgi:hypothetical protein